MIPEGGIGNGGRRTRAYAAVAPRWFALTILCTSGLLLGASAASATATGSRSRSASSSASRRFVGASDSIPGKIKTGSGAAALLVPRGGAGEGGVKKRRTKLSSSSSGGGGAKRKRKRRGGGGRPSEDAEEDEEEEGEEEGRRAIDAAMKEGDAATALGDAIRDRADVLRADATPRPPSPMNRIDASVASVGLALGTSDPIAGTQRKWKGEASADGEEAGDEDAGVGGGGGGVEASPTAVLANYFLRTHGGAHGVQCLLSLLSVAAGVAALLVPPPGPSDGAPAKVVLLRRSLLCALAKHASGLTAAAALEARRMPRAGFRGARRAAEALASDPVGQYLFYCSLLLVWAPSPAPPPSPGAAGAEGTGAAPAPMVIPWWLSSPRAATASSLCLLGPVLLREVVSTAWVASDVSVLLATSSSSRPGREPAPLRMARGAVDAVMSLLFTPARWRDASPAARQRTLARAVSKTSLGLEALTGLLITYDAVRAFSDYALSAVAQRPRLAGVAKRIVCAQLYMNFLLVRRRKINELVGAIRGGALHVPERVLDALLEPRKAMGLEQRRVVDTTESETLAESDDKISWKKNVLVALGID